MISCERISVPGVLNIRAGNPAFSRQTDRSFCPPDLPGQYGRSEMSHLSVPSEQSVPPVQSVPLSPWAEFKKHQRQIIADAGFDFSEVPVEGRCRVIFHNTDFWLEPSEALRFSMLSAGLTRERRKFKKVYNGRV